MKKPIYYRIFNYNKNLLPNVYLKSLEENVCTIEEAKVKTGLTIGYPGWGLLYYAVLSSLNPDKFNNIIETGSNYGCTTIVLAQALIDSKKNGHLYSIELDKENFKIAKKNLKSAKVDKYVTLINNNTHKVLPELLNNIDNISVAFMDASHMCDDVIKEFEIIYPKLNDNSLVIFDNTYLMAEEQEDQQVNGALRHILKTYGGNLVNFETVSWHPPGIAIWQRKPF